MDSEKKIIGPLSVLRRQRGEDLQGVSLRKQHR